MGGFGEAKNHNTETGILLISIMSVQEEMKKISATKARYVAWTASIEI